jgi:hypothetical protein
MTLRSGANYMTPVQHRIQSWGLMHQYNTRALLLDPFQTGEEKLVTADCHAVLRQVAIPSQEVLMWLMLW